MELISYKCPVCNGEDLPNIIESRNGNMTISIVNRICTFCYGKKELNWLEYLFGVKEPRIITFDMIPNSNYFLHVSGVLHEIKS